MGNATKKIGVQISLHYSDPASLSLESEEGWLAHMEVPFFFPPYCFLNGHTNLYNLTIILGSSFSLSSQTFMLLIFIVAILANRRQ